MKTPEQVSAAKKAIIDALMTSGLGAERRALFSGMLTAMAWVSDSPHGTTIDRLIAGEPIAAGKDPTKGNAILKSIADSVFECPTCGRPMAHSRLRGMFCLSCDGEK